MGTRQIFEDLQQAGLSLSLVGDTLRVVPREAITPAARALIREHKAALVELLRQGVATVQGTTQETSTPPPETATTAPTAPTPEPAAMEDWGVDAFTLAGQQSATQGTDLDEDAFQGRATVCEFAGGRPLEWAEGLSRIFAMRAPSDIPPQRWRAIQSAAATFCDKWVTDAHSLGWSLEQTFGCHQTGPIIRVDHCGLIMAMSRPDVELIALDADVATFAVGIRRVTQLKRRDQVCTWEGRFLWENPR
ncbi:MAG: hypothetical protein HQL90_14380 [Magnetococcales bacterium]|nr:hypothetical protein [Magnetococcales bacterium]